MAKEEAGGQDKGAEEAKEQKEEEQQENKEEEQKEVAVRGLPRGGVIIASAAGFAAKEFSMEEPEAAIKPGAALEKTPVRPLETFARGSP